MKDAGHTNARHEKPNRSARTAAELEEALANAVASLEDLERRCERERTMIEAALHPRAWKDWKLAQLDRWRREQREPLVLSMAKTYQQLMSERLMGESARATVRQGGAGPANTDHPRTRLN